MSAFNPPWVQARSLLIALTAGFAIVVSLLTLSAYTSLRSASRIQQGAARLSLEQIAAARLLNSVQADQHAFAEILHRYSSGRTFTPPQQLQEEMDDSRAAIRAALQAMPSSPLSAQWQSLDESITHLVNSIRALLNAPSRPTTAGLDQLFALNDQVIHRQGQILEATGQRIAAAEAQLQADSQQLALQSQLLLGSCFVISLVCAGLTILFVRHSIQTIQSQASQLSRVSWHLLQVQEIQARRFAHELHDELGQSLAALKASLQATTPQNLESLRGDCLQLADTSIANVREMSRLLHPVILDDFGLDAALRWLAEGFAQRTGIRVAYESTFHARLPEATETHLFRIAQEALTNVSRHANATTVRIHMEGSASQLQLRIADDGVGLPPHFSPGNSLGLIAMRARAAEIGATITFQPASPSGLEVTIVLPLPTTKENEL